MAAAAELSPDDPILALQAEILARPVTIARRMADAIRALAIDATDAAAAAASVQRVLVSGSAG